MNKLIQIVQLPIIQERLRSLKETVDKQVLQAQSLACTEETLLSVKAARAELEKQFESLESQRKAVKAAVLRPYEEFEGVYKECVGNAFNSADADLKAKICEVEDGIKQRCESEMREYFAELCAANHVEWLRFEQAGLKIGLAEARQKTRKKLREHLEAFTARVSQDIDAIVNMKDASEILVEYKRTLNMVEAIGIVQERNRRIAQEKTASVEYLENKQRETEAIRRVEAVAPPEPVYVEEYNLKILRPTKSQLIKIRDFLKQEGIEYEC